MNKIQLNEDTNVSGQPFQMKLIILVLLRTLRRADEFKLVVNTENSGNLVISLKYTKDDKSHTKNYVVCTRYKIDKRKTLINFDNFMEEGSDFHIVKFFESYNTIIESIQRGKLKLFNRSNDNEFIVYTNTSCQQDMEHLKMKPVDDIIVATNGYELKLDDENKVAFHNLLKESSSSKRLAKLLAEFIFKRNEALDMRNGLLHRYKGAVNKLVRLNRNKRCGNFDSKFINGEDLTEIERKFRTHFYREISTIIKNDLKESKLPSKTKVKLANVFKEFDKRPNNGAINKFLLKIKIKLPNKFIEKCNDSYDELPDDDAMYSSEKCHKFLNKFRIFIEQTGESNFNNIIVKEIQETFYLDEKSSKIMYSQVRGEVENWFHSVSDDAVYLTHNNDYFNVAFNRLMNISNYRSMISKYDVRFSSVTISHYKEKLRNAECVIDIKCNQTLLHAMLWYQCLKNMVEYSCGNKYIIIQLAALIKIQNVIFKAFRDQVKMLIVVVEGDETGIEILEEIYAVTNNDKKCIIINKGDKSQQEIELNDFDEKSQNSLKQKVIDYQGVLLPLNELNISELLEESDITALICEENLKIGTVPENYCSYFIERCLFNNTTIKSFDNLKGRVIGLHGDKGCGKTEFLNYLVQQEHSKNNFLWMSKVTLTSSDILSECMNLAKAIDFLVKKLQLKPLSKEVFRKRIESDGNIILIFEISDNVGFNFNKNFNNLLHILKSTKIEKIVISFLTLKNTEELDYIYNLREFNYQEQCTLIEKLWELKFDSQAIKNCIEALLHFFANHKPHLALTLGNPRNIKILAEINHKVVQEMISKNPKDYNFSVYKGLNNFYEYSIGQERLKSKTKYDLLQAIRNNNHDEIKKIIRSEPNLVNASYGEPFNKQLLAIACNDFAKVVNLDTIKWLLRLGADLHHREERQQNRNILEFATLGQNKLLLDFLIDSVKNDEILNGSALLNLIIDEGNPLDDDYLPCVQTLLQYCDEKQRNDMKITPLQNAAKKQYIEVVNQILDHYMNQQINYSISEFEAIKLIGVKIEDWNIRACPDNVKGFLNTLDIDNEKTFVDWIELCINKEHDDDIKSTFLKIACKRNLFNTVNVLLKSKKYCKWEFKDDNHPIMIAAKNGYYKIFQCLIEHEDTKMNDVLLSKLLKALEKRYNESGNYAKCFIRLVKNLHKKFDANLQVINDYHLLHYAVKYCGSKTVLELLKSGASLANENSNKTLTIQNIDADTLREHFDRCIYTPEEYHRKKNKDELPNDDKVIDVDNPHNTDVVFDYSSLYPKNVKQETNSVRNGNYTTNESKVLHHISQHSELHPLLEHSLINSFLELKWKQVKWIFFTNLIFYSLFCASLVCYSLPYYYLYTELDQNLNYWLKAPFYVMLVILILRELFQIYISQIEYCYNFENYLEWTLIIIVIAMSFTETSSVTLKQQLCAAGLLLAAFELLFLIGNFDSCVIYVVMLRKVSVNFFKCFFVYIILIITFTISFHTLFRNNFTIESEPYITNIFYSLFKTIIMLTGSVEADETLFEHYPYANFFVFILFVFLMTIILFNLMNGLAVSDTGEIQNNAQQIRLAARVDFIRYAENIASKLNKQKRVNTADKFSLYPKYLKNYTANSKDCNFNENIIKSAMQIILERNRKLKHEFDRKQKDLEICEIRKKLNEQDKMLKEILFCLKNNK